MMKFSVKLCLFLLLFLLLDRVLGGFMFATVQSGKADQRFGKLIHNQLRTQVLILGSSRSARNFVASEISAGTGKSVYNLGFPGSNIDFHLQLLQLVLDSGNIPECVVLAVDDDLELRANTSLDFRYDVLYPWANDPKVQAVLVARDKFDSTLSKLLVTYCARNVLWDCVRAVRKGNEGIAALNAYREDGSMPLDLRSVTWAKMTFQTDRKPYDAKGESSQLLGTYKKFIDTCTKNKIKLAIVFTPNYWPRSAAFESRIRDISGTSVPYFDYSSYLTDKDLFYDASHLNSKGATAFSRSFASDLKGYLAGQR